MGLFGKIKDALKIELNMVEAVPDIHFGGKLDNYPKNMAANHRNNLRRDKRNGATR